MAAASGQGTAGVYKVGGERKDPVAKADQELKGIAKPITGLAFSSNGSAVYASSEDGTVRGFQAANGSQSFSANHGAPVHALAISLDGKYLASAGENKEIRVWNTSNGSPAPKNQFAGFEAPVKSVAFSVDSQRVIGGAANGEALVFNLTSGETEQAYREQTGSLDALAAAGTQSPYIVSASADKSVRRFAPAAVRSLAGHSKPVTSLATLPTANTQILSGSEDGTVRHWNTTNGQAVRTMSHWRAGGVGGRASRRPAFRFRFVEQHGQALERRQWPASGGVERRLSGSGPGGATHHRGQPCQERSHRATTR